ncbi:MAG TPA: AMP-binding protein [Ilumatobacter sp.]|nr:AMP-binding protein [Ilumatobacter sp.]
MRQLPLGERLHQLAAERSDRAAVHFARTDATVEVVSWAELDDRSTQLGRWLATNGVTVGDLVPVMMRNSPRSLMSLFAVWKVGGVPVPLPYDLPGWEIERLLAVLHGHGRSHPIITADSECFDESRKLSSSPLPEVTPPHSSGICSAGSTGQPKIILRKPPGVFGAGSSTAVVESWGPLTGPQRILTPAPMHHNNGFVSVFDLLAGHELVFMERFDAAGLARLVETRAITGFTAATIVFQRVAAILDEHPADLSTLQWVIQGASVCPEWLARRWCDLIGPERVFFAYGSSEGIGATCARGDEWLANPGTLGRGLFGTEVRILDDDGRPVPDGVVGDIYLRSARGISHEYLGPVAPTPVTADGFATNGDQGWVDDQGWLFMADRRQDVIITGGVNVYPAEVESALSEHSSVADVVVVGLTDPEWGHRVHAIVQPRSGASVDSAELIAYARQKLAPAKVPKTVEVVATIERSAAMKVNRRALAATRELTAKEATCLTS